MTAVEYESREIAELDQASERARWVEAGYRALGYQMLAQYDRGLLIGERPVLRHAEDVRGLPQALVDAARAAIAAQSAAQAIYEAKSKQAQADIARMGLNGTAADYHVQITRGEAWGKLAEATRAVRPAVGRLGQVVEQVTAHRAVITATPQKRQAAEEHCRLLMAQLDQAEADARRALLILGATE